MQAIMDSFFKESRKQGTNKMNAVQQSFSCFPFFLLSL